MREAPFAISFPALMRAASTARYVSLLRFTRVVGGGRRPRLRRRGKLGGLFGPAKLRKLIVDTDESHMDVVASFNLMAEHEINHAQERHPGPQRDVERRLSKFDKTVQVHFCLGHLVVQT